MKSPIARITTALGLSIACCTSPADATPCRDRTAASVSPVDDDAALGRQGSNFIEFWFGSQERRGKGGDVPPAR